MKLFGERSCVLKKVLIVTQWFPPLNMIASKRFGIMCRYFEKYGYRPYVLTTVAHKISGSGFSLGMECPVDEDQITRICRMGTGYTPKSFSFNMLWILGGYFSIHWLRQRWEDMRGSKRSWIAADFRILILSSEHIRK